MPGVFLWAYDTDNSTWRKVLVDDEGRLVMSIVLARLDDIEDVNVASPTDGDFIEWDDTTSKWIKIAHKDAATGVHGVGAGSVVGTTLTQTLTLKTLTTPVIASIYQDAGKTKLLTLPAATDTLVGKATTDILTNKTLIAPDINGGTVDAITSLTVANDVDIGNYNLRAKTLQSDVATGTAPLTVASTTLVANLNADKLDNNDYSDISSEIDTDIATHAALTATHGATGAIVGTTNTQNLTNKTLTSPTINGTIATTGLTMPAFTLGGAIAGGAQELNNLGIVYIGDTANAKMTLGLTINQGAADDEIFAGKSSEVAHPMTGLTEADTFLTISKAQTTSGGAAIKGFKDSGGVAGMALMLWGILGEAADTTKNTNAYGLVQIYGSITDGGTGYTNPGADANLVVIYDHITARYIFDVEGSAHADVEWTTYDHYDDDLALIRDIEQELLLREKEGDKSQTARRHLLEDAGIIGKGSWHFENGKPKAMVNMTKLAMLHHGALLQVYGELESLKRKSEELEHKLALIGG